MAVPRPGRKVGVPVIRDPFFTLRERSRVHTRFVLMISANGILQYSFWETREEARQRMEQEYRSFCEIQGVEPRDEHWITDCSAYADVETRLGVQARLSAELAEIPEVPDG